jgi:hypothetical protein
LYGAFVGDGYRSQTAMVSAIAQVNGKRLNKSFPGIDAAQKERTKTSNLKNKVKL